MAVTIDVAALASAIRAGSTALETAEITRIRDYAIEAISRHLGVAYDTVPETVVNEACIRLTGYIYDKPTSARGAAWANGGRNSGAWSTLLPYVIHRAGGVAQATAAAQAAVGSAGNPVVGVTVDAAAGTLTVIFADGTTQTETLPAGGMGGGAGLDQTARDAAQAAQTTADAAAAGATAAASTADSASTAAAAAQGTADANATAIAGISAVPHVYVQTDEPTDARLADIWLQDFTTAHPVIYEHNGTSWVQDYAFLGGRCHFTNLAVDVNADTPAANGGDMLFQVSVATDQLNIYRRLIANSAPYWDYIGETTGGGGGSGVDQTARDAAAAAQATAAAAQSTATANANKLMPPAPAEATNGTATAIRGWTAALIRTLVEAVAPARDSVIGVEDGRLPGPPIAMRLGWNQSRTMTAAVFTRANDHPIDGAVSGMSDGLAAPPFPPALDTDPSLYLGIWLAGDPDIADIPSGFPVADKRALTVDGTAGHYFPSSNRLAASVTGTVYRIVIAGPRILTENDLADLGGGTPTVQVDEIAMNAGTFGNLGSGRTLLVPYPAGTTRQSYDGKCVDCHVFANVSGHFPQGSRVLTLSGSSFWLSEGGVGAQWNVLLQDDGIRMYIPFAVTSSAITAATVYLARMVI